MNHGSVVAGGHDQSFEHTWQLPFDVSWGWKETSWIAQQIAAEIYSSDLAVGLLQIGGTQDAGYTGWWTKSG